MPSMYLFYQNISSGPTIFIKHFIIFVVEQNLFSSRIGDEV